MSRPWDIRLKSESTSVETRKGPILYAGVEEGQRFEQDLLDEVQNELVALIVELAHAQEDPDTSPAVAHTLADLDAHAQAALDELRNIALWVRLPPHADVDLREALRRRAARAPST